MLVSGLIATSGPGRRNGSETKNHRAFPGPVVQREKPLGGYAVLGEEALSESSPEGLASPTEKGGGSVSRAADVLSHLFGLHSLQMEGENELLILAERIDSPLNPLHGLAGLHLTVSLEAAREIVKVGTVRLFPVLAAT